jgi:hypothetical protein
MQQGGGPSFLSPRGSQAQGSKLFSLLTGSDIHGTERDKERDEANTRNATILPANSSWGSTLFYVQRMMGMATRLAGGAGLQGDSALLHAAPTHASGKRPRGRFLDCPSAPPRPTRAPISSRFGPTEGAQPHGPGQQGSVAVSLRCSAS